MYTSTMGMTPKVKVPQPFPYQGSKRFLAPLILPYVPTDCATFVEPFAGSAAMSLAIAARKLAKGHIINDINGPLTNLWKQIITQPEWLAERYSEIWKRQHGRGAEYFKEVRAEFNRTREPDLLLFLLARCCKAAVRYNQKGEFNQSADPRRTGMIPGTMRASLLATSALLKGKAEVSSTDYGEVCLAAKPEDVIYLDPPYQGVSKVRDTRYCSKLTFEQFVGTLRKMNADHLSYIVSYDGRTGDKTYGDSLPHDLGLELMEIKAGRSSQATLLGRSEITFESLYLSPSLKARLS